MIVLTVSFAAVSHPWLCAWFVLCGAFAAAWIISWRTSRDPFAPLLPVAGYIFLGIGIRGIGVREGWLPDNYNLPLGSQWLTVSVWLLGALAIACCCLGYLSRTGVRFGRRSSADASVRRRIPQQIAVGFSVACVLIGALSLVLLRNRFGSISGFGQTPAVVASRTSEGGLFGIDALAYFPLVGALLMWRAAGVGLTGKLALVANLVLVIAWFAIAGRKALLFELILALFILRHYLRKRIRGRTFALLAIPALIVVSLAFYFKDYGFKTHSIEVQYSNQPVWAAVIDPLVNRSYQFDAVTMILDKTRSVDDYRFGSTFDDLLWFYVPRQWWPDKPVSFGYRFGPEFFPGANATESYAPSMVGELYLDFGLIGVAGGFYLFGIALRACYESFAIRRSRLSAVVYAIILFRLTNMVEGPVSTHIEFLLAELTPIAVLVVTDRIAIQAGQVHAPGAVTRRSLRIPEARAATHAPGGLRR